MTSQTQPHIHDWRGIDTGRMCYVCGEIETMTFQPDHHKVLAEIDPWLRLRDAAPAMLVELEHELEDIECWLRYEGICQDMKDSLSHRHLIISQVVKSAKGEL
jgi:hypothetical protein